MLADFSFKDTEVDNRFNFAHLPHQDPWGIAVDMSREFALQTTRR